MSCIRRRLEKSLALAWLLWLGVIAAGPANGLEPRQQVQQALYSLGVHGLFDSLQPLLERELQRYRAEGFEFPLDDAQLAEALDTETLQANLEARLLQSYEPQLYAEVIATLSEDSITPVIQSCHGQALRDHGPELQAYEQQLALQPSRPARQQLALQLDQVARTSQIAAQLHNNLDQSLYRLAGKPATEIQWHEVQVERVAVLRQATVVWYLYCARFYQDEQLKGTIDSYQLPEIQQLLDSYQRAVSEVMLGAIGELMQNQDSQ